jgi:DNA mismatch repair protein MutS
MTASTMTSTQPKEPTPAMRQFHRFKQEHPDCVLFFRMGDFYEMFYDDAKLAHKVMGVTLTQRSKGVPMAGVPYHAVENYLRRMIEAGHRVAICDQVEDPAQAKGVVRRDVTRLITPGTLTDASMLDEASENPLAALAWIDASTACVAWAELSTGSLWVGSFNAADLGDELARIAPREILYARDEDAVAADAADSPVAVLARELGAVATGRPQFQFRCQEAAEVLKRQYDVATLGGFGFEESDPVLGPLAAIVHYLLETQRSADGSDRTRLVHLAAPRRFSREQHMVIDQISLRSLEIDRTMRAGTVEGSVLGALQDCVTAMGKRLLRRWLCYPLRDRAAIETRQRTVAALVEDASFLNELREQLGRLQDIPRMMARLSVGRPTPRDLVGLGHSAREARSIADLLAGRPAVSPYHKRIEAAAADLAELAARIEAACVEAPPAHMRDGGLIRDGFDERLDEQRGLQRDSRAWLADYQKTLVDETQIQSLKIAFNRVFGYYIEVTAANRDRVPDGWSRRQTLKNAERYVTPQLKEFEGKVLGAEQRAVAREQELFADLCQHAAQRSAQLGALADVAAALDVLACFARRAVRRRYVRPTIVDEPQTHIVGGRHPVLDELLDDRFVPNDVQLGSGPDASAATLALITGPNMAGKSTYIRQTALLVLMAHCGSFIPADEATIGLCDRVFTRVGASDELHTGQSTFMVEMTETASICHHATESSLVILDEIGRGTSTLDGLALAWAVAEHLARRGCRTLFATHYHELTALAERFTSVVNLNVTVREWQDKIVFLHRIIPGATDRSYGIHVAKIAGVPTTVIDRANQLLAELEVSHRGPAPDRQPAAPDAQLSLFTEYLPHPALEALRQLDLDKLSPIEAFDTLRRLGAMIKDGG